MPAPRHSALIHGGSCRRCGYSLNELPVEHEKCPECGTEIHLGGPQISDWGLNDTQKHDWIASVGGWLNAILVFATVVGVLVAFIVLVVR